MKRYLVDVSGLSADEKESAYKQISSFAFMATRMFDEHRRLSGIEVYWTDREDFRTSPIFPVGCPCVEG